MTGQLCASSGGRVANQSSSGPVETRRQDWATAVGSGPAPDRGAGTAASEPNLRPNVPDRPLEPDRALDAVAEEVTRLARSLPLDHPSRPSWSPPAPAHPPQRPSTIATLATPPKPTTPPHTRARRLQLPAPDTTQPTTPMTTRSTITRSTKSQCGDSEASTSSQSCSGQPSHATNELSSSRVVTFSSAGRGTRSNSDVRCDGSSRSLARISPSPVVTASRGSGEPRDKGPV